MSARLAVWRCFWETRSLERDSLAWTPNVLPLRRISVNEDEDLRGATWASREVASSSLRPLDSSVKRVDGGVAIVGAVICTLWMVRRSLETNLNDRRSRTGKAYQKYALS
jgi:hypothetical protein